MKEGWLVVNSLQISWICTSLSLAIISEDVHRNAVILGITLRPFHTNVIIMLNIREFRCFVFGGGAGSFPPNSPNHRGNQQLLVTVVTQTPRIWVVAYKQPVHRLALRWANWAVELQHWGKATAVFWREIAHCMHLLEVGTYYCYIGTWRRI